MSQKRKNKLLSERTRLHTDAKLSAKKNVSRYSQALCFPYSQRSLVVSISPNRSLLPPLRGVPADVADAAEDVEKAAEGFSVRILGGVRLSCWVLMTDW